MSHPRPVQDGPKQTFDVGTGRARIDTTGEHVGNSSASAAQSLEELERQGTIGPETPKQSVDPKTDLSGTGVGGGTSYARESAPQGPQAGLGSLPPVGPGFKDGREKK